MISGNQRGLMPSMALPNLSTTTTSTADAALLALGPLGVATATLCLSSGRLSWSIFFVRVRDQYVLTTQLSLAAFLPFLTSILNLVIVNVVSPTLVILPEGPQMVYRVMAGSTGESLRVAAEALLGIGIALRYAFLHAHLAARPKVLGPSLKLPAPISSRDVSPSASGNWQQRPAKKVSHWLAQAVNGTVTTGVVAVAVLECTWRLAYLIAEGEKSMFHAIYLTSSILQTTLLAFFLARCVHLITSTPFIKMRGALLRELSPILLGLIFALVDCIGGIVQAGFTEMTVGRLLSGFQTYAFLVGILLITFTLEGSSPAAKTPFQRQTRKAVKHASSFVGLHTPRTSTFHLSPPGISALELAAPDLAARPDSTTRPPSTYLLNRGPSIRRPASLRDVRSWLGPKRSSVNMDNEEDRLWIATDVGKSTGGPTTSTASFGDNAGTATIWPSSQGQTQHTRDPDLTLSSAKSSAMSLPTYSAGRGQVDFIMRAPIAAFGRPKSQTSLDSSLEANQNNRGTLNTDKRFSVARILMERRGSQRVRDMFAHRLSGKATSGSSTEAARNSTTPSDASLPMFSDFPFPQPPARSMKQALPVQANRKLDGQQVPEQVSMSYDDLFSFNSVMPALQMNSKSDSAMSSFDVTSFIEAGGHRSSADTRRETLLDSLIGPSHLRRLIRAAELDDISSASSSASFDMGPPRRVRDNDDVSSLLDTPTVMEVTKATLERATIRRSSSNTRPLESPLEPSIRVASHDSASGSVPNTSAAGRNTLAPSRPAAAAIRASSPQAPSPSKASSTRTSMTFGRPAPASKTRPPPLTLTVGRQPSRPRRVPNNVI